MPTEEMPKQGIDYAVPRVMLDEQYIEELTNLFRKGQAPCGILVISKFFDMRYGLGVNPEKLMDDLLDATKAANVHVVKCGWTTTSK